MNNIWREIKKMAREFNLLLAHYLAPAVRAILVTNVALFILYMLTTPFSENMQTFFYYLMQTPVLAVEHFCVWQFFTYMFMHGTVFHLLMNMLILWFFASRLERRWGTSEFLRFYLIVGVGAGLFHTAMAYLSGRSGSPMLGASGALYGVMLAYALAYPNDTVLLYFVIPVKIKYLMIVLGVMTFFSSISSTMGNGGNGISHVTHLGGLVVAFFYLHGGKWMKPRRGRKKARILKVDPKRHPDFF